MPTRPMSTPASSLRPGTPWGGGAWKLPLGSAWSRVAMPTLSEHFLVSGEVNCVLRAGLQGESETTSGGQVESHWKCTRWLWEVVSSLR